MRGLESDKRILFSDNNAADLMSNDDIGFWGGRKGEVVITRVDDLAIEGTLAFTASSSRTNNTVAVKNGFFRIPNL